MSPQHKRAQVVRILLIALATAAGCPAEHAKESQSPEYSSAYERDSKSVAGADLSELAKAPLQYHLVMHFPESREAIFDFILNDVEAYVGPVIEAEVKNAGRTVEVGSARHCTFRNGDVLVEPLLHYDYPSSYAYGVDEAASTRKLPVDNAMVHYTFEETASGGTLVSVRGYFEARGMKRRLMKLVFDRTFAEAAKLRDGTIIRLGK